MSFIGKQRIFSKNNKNSLDELEYKININIPNSYIMNLIKYTYCNRDQVSKRNLVNLWTLLSVIDEVSTYEDNPTMIYKFRFLKESVDIIINEKVIYDSKRKSMIVDYFRNYIDKQYIPEDIIDMCIKRTFGKNAKELKPEDITILTKFVEDRLAYKFIYEEQSNLETVLQKIKVGSNVNDFIYEFKDIIGTLNKNLHNVANSDDYTNQSFSFDVNTSVTDKVFNEFLSRKRKGDYKLKSGYFALNKMLNGGFQGSRVYMLYGAPKSFKSGTLLNIAISICRYNSNLKERMKDPEKRPCVVYFTQENSQMETIERIAQCVFGDEDIRNWSSEKLKDGIKSYIFDVNGIDLKVIYKPCNSVTTSYLYTICDDLELDGEECICMIQDYVKRIRSTVKHPDLRIELGEIVNEFSVFAKEKNIPVITAGQLNREATRLIDNYSQANANNYTKSLNASHIGESLLMLENTDYGIIVNRERVKETNMEYVSFKLIASRAKNNDKDFEYFSQPIDINGGFRIEEDCDKSIDEMLAVKDIGSSLEGYKSPEEVEEVLNNTLHKRAKKTSKVTLKKGSEKIVYKQTENFLDDENEFDELEEKDD